MVNVQIPKKMTLPLFITWLRENLQCELSKLGQRLEVIINANNIEPGTFAALYAEMQGDKVMVSELAETFYSMEEARAALDNPTDTYDPVSFHQWVKDQYWTAKGVKVEKIVF
jgi:hypothetical protein